MKTLESANAKHSNVQQHQPHDEHIHQTHRIGTVMKFKDLQKMTDEELVERLFSLSREPHYKPEDWTPCITVGYLSPDALDNLLATQLTGSVGHTFITSHDSHDEHKTTDTHTKRSHPQNGALLATLEYDSPLKAAHAFRTAAQLCKNHVFGEFELVRAVKRHKPTAFPPQPHPHPHTTDPDVQDVEHVEGLTDKDLAEKLFKLPPKYVYKPQDFIAAIAVSNLPIGTTAVELTEHHIAGARTSEISQATDGEVITLEFDNPEAAAHAYRQAKTLVIQGRHTHVHPVRHPGRH